MYDETSRKLDSDTFCADSPATTSSPAADTSRATRSAHLPEDDDAPFFVVVRPPIPGKTAWSMAPW